MSRIAVTASLVACVAAASLAWPAAPWASGWLLLAAIVVAVALRIQGDRTKAMLANVGALTLALAGVEAYMGFVGRSDDDERMEGTITRDFIQRDDDLGYAPKKGSRATARKLYRGQILYDVAYTIDADGLRAVPSPSSTGRVDCIDFFGDSITFGEGVEDDEAYPSRVARLAGGHLLVRNHAFSGYGPHQMLAALTHGRVEHDPRCRSRRFVYLAIPEHVARVAGLAPWDRHGPRYRRADDGRVFRDGHFDDPRHLLGWRVPPSIEAMLAKSLVYRRFFGTGRTPGAEDLELFLAVVRESGACIAERFPGSPFDVIVWDARSDPRIATIESRLVAMGARVHRLTAAIPDLEREHARYEISPHDPHPNPLWHERVAKYVASTMIALDGRSTLARQAVVGGGPPR